MSKTYHLSLRIDKEVRERFFQLCEEEGIDVSQGVRDLIYEAVARGYIIKERKERMKKLTQGGTA